MKCTMGISWNKSSFEAFDFNIDGHGTNDGWVTGFRDDEEWEAPAQSLFPHNDDDVEIAYDSAERK